MKNEIISKIKSELKKADKPENIHDYQRFFKEKLKEPFGLRSTVLRKISNAIFKEIKHLPKSEILDLCDSILKSDIRYKRFFAFDWSEKLKNKFEKKDFALFERWLDNYITDWANCDHLCGNVIGHVVAKFPELSSKTKKWAKSKNLWLRRASAVSLIQPVRKKLLLDDVFKTADILLLDDEDMVQKGYGWMLKVAGDIYPDEVFAYVMKHRDKMPRTALRYAIEKYPQDMRKKAMER